MSIRLTHSSKTADTDVLSDVYRVLQTSDQVPGKREQAWDNSTEKLDDFYKTNSSVIDAALTGLTSMDARSIQNAISSFQTTSKIIMEGLDELGKIHPFISVAVIPFKLVITLDMMRRENNEKVIAIRIQMRQMLCTLFQLRNVKDEDWIGPDGKKFGDTMQPLMHEIADAIKECGSACSIYLQKSLLKRVLKSQKYEDRLSAYAATFLEYKDRLEMSLTVHTTLAVDNIQRIARNQIDMLKQIIQKLDTPKERELDAYIVSKGGPSNVILQDDSLKALVEMSGEKMDDLAKKSATEGVTGVGGKDTNINSVRKMLKDELAEDIDKIIKGSMENFNQKLEIQHGYLERLVNMISTGTHDKIKDKDLQKLWQAMDWKGSVKAQHFVMALRDYFRDQLALGTPSARNIDLPLEPQERPHTDQLTIPIILPALADDKWALQFLNVAHLPSIREAIDDDGTGFINIKEANTFAIEKPKGWRLLHWIAYWARGWEISLARYKSKICLILQEMFKLSGTVLVENRGITEHYLYHYSITGIEQILRATKTLKDYDDICSELTMLTEDYVSKEEERLRKNLERIGYDIDSAVTVSLIAGSSRIERNLFPLLYLTLKKHLEVFYYAKCHIVDKDEFIRMRNGLGAIFDVVEQRAEDLKAICKQARIDLESFFGNFSLGIFSEFAKSKYNIRGTEGLILAWQDTSPTQDETAVSQFIEDPEATKPIFSANSESQDTYHGVWDDWSPHSFDSDPFLGALNGAFTGLLSYSIKGEKPSPRFLIQLKLEVDKQGGDDLNLKGVGVTSYFGRSKVYGRRKPLAIQPEMEGEVKEEPFDLVLSYNEGYTIRLIGSFVRETEQLVGKWMDYDTEVEAQVAYQSNQYTGENKDPGEEVDTGRSSGLADRETEAFTDKTVEKSFFFCRSAAEIFHCRPLLESDQNTALSRWVFLKAAVLHLVRLHSSFWVFFKYWGKQRQTFLDIHKRRLLAYSNCAIPNPLTPEEELEYHNLQITLPPSLICLCAEALQWSLHRASYHHSIGCDGCAGQILLLRYICLTCMDSEMSNTIDLCSNCIDKSAQRDQFIHTPDHTMIKSRRYVHEFERTSLFIKARLLAIRTKRTLSELSDDRGGMNSHVIGEETSVRKDSESVLRCRYCASPISIPCYICLICEVATYLCPECEAKEACILPDGSADTKHRPYHHLLRIHNLDPVSFEEDVEDTTVTRIAALESKLDALTTSITNMKSATETQITALTTSLGTKLEYAQGATDTRIASLESKLDALTTNFVGLEAKMETFLKAITQHFNIPMHYSNGLEGRQEEDSSKAVIVENVSEE